MFYLYFYVPESHLEKVKEAIFAAGAGSVGNYSCCAWQIKGEGQYLPMSGSNPFIGQVNKIEHIIEIKVETVCRQENLSEVINALKKTHPYETPAYGIIPIAI